MSDVTQILEVMKLSGVQAANELLPLVYSELRALAEHRLSRESPDHSLQPTALVHEAYLRLIGSGDPGWEGRGHFFAAAAEAMRRILVERARARGRLKRGGDRVRIELLDQAECLEEDPTLVLSLDDLLPRLAMEDADTSRIAQLHLFGGLTVEQAAEVMNLSRATAYRNWRYARAWIRQALGE